MKQPKLPKPPKPVPAVVTAQDLSTTCTMHLITSRDQAHGAAWQELMDMPYISTKIMRAYLREFKQGWRVGSVAYITTNDTIVAMGLCLTVKPIFAPPTHVVAFYVSPAFRRQGFGKKLYTAVTGALPNVSKQPWHFDHDEKSHGFYTNLGVAKETDKLDKRPGTP